MPPVDAFPPLALTMGEPAGIGPDVTLFAWQQKGAFDLPAFYCLGDPDLLRGRAELLGLEVPIAEIGVSETVEAFEDVLPVVPLTGKTWGAPGRPSAKDVPLIIEAIERAVRDVQTGDATGVVTNPINKHALTSEGFAFPGHTEFLASLVPGPDGKPPMPVMMLAGPELRTVPVTIHIPLSAVPGAVSANLIVATGEIVARDLQTRFGLSRPRLAIAGLNPHAGENGVLGEEDDLIVRPAVEALRALGVDAVGPLPADTMFHVSARAKYDVALCMYHDQALIPAKTLGFDDAVNVTLGLPFIRTSPDHGTAFAVAGTGDARPSSLIAALRLARSMAIAESRR